MNGFFQWLNQPLPMGVTMLIGLGILWFRVKDNIKAVQDLRKDYNIQVKWCLDHFSPKGNPDR